MPKEKNIQIGEVTCPYKGCTQTAAVFRFRERSDDPKNRRFGGKLYARCPRHGLIHDNDGLLDGANIWGPSDKPAAAPAPAPTPAAVPPQKAPVKPAPASSSSPDTAPAKKPGGLFL